MSLRNVYCVLLVWISLVFSCAHAGVIDLSFAHSGILIQDLGFHRSDNANAVIQQHDGKIVIAGSADNGVNRDFALVRLNEDGTLDNRFGSGGIITTDIAATDDVATSVIEQSDGKLVVAGYSDQGVAGNFAMLRYNTDGSRDASFGNNGKVVAKSVNPSPTAFSMVSQSDGMIVVAGIPDYSRKLNRVGNAGNIARFTRDGQPDTGFAYEARPGGQSPTGNYEPMDVRAVIQQWDGKLLVVGSATLNSQVYCLALPCTANSRDVVLQRFNQDGFPDKSFDGDGFLSTHIAARDEAYGVTQQPDGKLVVAGSVYNGTDTHFFLLRYNVGGSIDATFGNNGIVKTALGDGPDVARSITTQTDGKLLVAGLSQLQGKTRFALVRYNSDGSIDTGFGEAGHVFIDFADANAELYAMLPQRDGKLVLVGNTGAGNSLDFAVARYVVDADTDGDGVSDNADALPLDPLQSARPDADFDGVANAVDNCPWIANPDQLDTDNDGVGDVCDNAPLIANADQLDTDSDGIGNVKDNCPFVVNGNQLDSDGGSPMFPGDGIGDVCDSTPHGDDDSDGIDNLIDNCRWSANADQLDTDGDGQGDACDSDDDNDGVPDVNDAFPQDATESVDTDGDGIGNNADSTPNGDIDSDGIDNLVDNCPAVSNADQKDTDADGQGDACDSDDDNDGVADTSDAFPLDKNESIDTDGDGTGNNADTDDDNDGVADTSDVFPLDKNESVDTDGDGIGDNADSTPNGDTDDDGIDNLVDNCPTVANADQLDSDSDGKGDVCDLLPNDAHNLLTLDGTVKGAHLGSAIALHDMDSDGVLDVVIGSPQEDVTIAGKLLRKAGVIRVLSGKTNTVINTFNGTAVNQQFGAALAVTADGNLVVGEPLVTVTNAQGKKLPRAGQVSLYNGIDGTFIQTIAQGSEAGSAFGNAVALADVDGDSEADLLVGVPNLTVTNGRKLKGAGAVMVFHGLSDQFRYLRLGSQAGEHFGAAIAIDSGRHVIVGSPDYDAVTANGVVKNAGRVQIFPSHQYNGYLKLVEGTERNAHLGASVAAANDQWAVGVLGANHNAGEVRLFPLFDTTVMRTLSGANTGDGFGSALALGDVDADGLDDVAVGSPGAEAHKLKDAGSVKVIAGRP